MAQDIAKSRFFRRLFDAFVPFLAWFLITLPLWLSPFHPAMVAYFIIAFDLYFFYKSALTVYRAVVAYKKTLIFSKMLFAKKLKALKNAGEINHFIIVPNYKEPLRKLEETIESIISNDYPFKNFFLVLAFEEREFEAREKAEALSKKYQKFFRDILISYHLLLQNEAPGKASNQTAACKVIELYLKQKGYDYEASVITVCDADSHLPKNYFSYLTYEYLKDPGRKYHFYCAPVLLYNNFWQLPFFMRMQATLSSIVRLAFLEYKENLIQISTYSTNFWLLEQINFWDIDIIPEDWHLYLQAFFKFGEKIGVLPLYTIINGDAVFSGNILKTSINRYEQEKRWAWGVSDIGYAINRFFDSPGIDPILKLKKIVFLIESHLLWPISFFILTISAWVPPLINPVFKRTVLGFLLPKLSAFILTLASALLVVYIYLDIKLRQKVNQKTSLKGFPLLIIQWYLLPIVSFLFSSLPALDAHTRLLFGKKLKYHVTEKV